MQILVDALLWVVGGWAWHLKCLLQVADLLLDFAPVAKGALLLAAHVSVVLPDGAWHDVVTRSWSINLLWLQVGLGQELRVESSSIGSLAHVLSPVLEPASKAIVWRRASSLLLV